VKRKEKGAHRLLPTKNTAKHQKTPPFGEAFVGSFSKKNLEGGAAIWYYYLDKRRPFGELLL